MHDPEISRRYAAMGNLGVVLACGAAGDDEVTRVPGTGEWQGRCCGGPGDTGQRPDALESLVEEPNGLTRRVVLWPREHDLRREHALRVEPRIDLGQLSKAAHE